MAEKFVEKKTKVAESKIESTIVEALEKECSELGKDLEKERVKTQDKSIEILQLKKVIDQQSVVI